MQPFVRQLGAEPGVQLNPLRDLSELPATGNADQSFGVVMRATRGRIDRPFRVDRGTLGRKLGRGETIRQNALNEAWVQVAEALNNGAYEAVVSRLVTDAARIRWAVLRLDAQGAPAFAVEDACPDAGFLLAVKHLECFNDGIVLECHADEKRVGGVAVAQTAISLRVRDVQGNVLFGAEGSLQAGAVDDFGQSRYLPDVADRLTDALEIVVGDVASLAPASPLYGYDLLGREKWVKSATLVCFEEGGFAYTASDYQRACQALQDTNLAFGYLVSGGTRAVGLLVQLAQLAVASNTQLRFDVPGELSVDAAEAFVEQLNFGAAEAAHLLHGFWCPLRSDDPTGINPRGVIGASALNVAYACRRNSQKNAKGFAPKQYPIAGNAFALRRTRIEQLCQPSGQELSRLAKAKIIPVLFESYAGGGLYVFRDILTQKPTDNSLAKLTSVADMAVDLELRVSHFAKSVMFLPMQVAVTRMKDYLADMLADAQTSGWLMPSTAEGMDGAAFRYVVNPNAARPYDVMDVEVWVRFDGAVRQIFVTANLTK